MLADSAWHPAIIPIPCNVGGAKEPENIKWNLYKVIINEKSKMKNELHDHQAHGSKESLRFFLLELGLESSCHPTSCIRIDRQVHSVKDIFDFIFFLKHFFIPEHPHRCRLLHFYVWDINKIGFVKIFFRDHNCVKTRITSLLQVFSLLK